MGVIMNPDRDKGDAYWQIQLDDIKRAATFYPTPGEGFDPLDPENASDLVKFGLPPRPDPEAEPVRYKFWRKLVSQPANYPALSFVKTDFAWPEPRPFLHELNPRRSSELSGARHQSSANWSGGYITPKNGLMFIEVHGLWQVPAPSLPPGAGANADCWSSTWIGLDGQRRYLHASLPQIGTEQRVTATAGGAQTAIKVWWQWWVRGQHRPPLYLPLPVGVGDLIRSQLNVLAPTSPGAPMQVKFFIKNETTGAALTPFDYPAPQATMETGPSPIQLRVSGATAEWVTERPTKFQSDVLHQLPKYGSVLFSECYAAAAIDPSTPPVVQLLPGARLIDMFEIRTAPQRNAKISIARRQGRQSLSTVHR